MSNSKNTAEFRINLIGNIAERAKKISDGVQKIGLTGQRSMRVFNASVSGSNKVIDAFDNKLTGIVTGGGLALFSKQVGNQMQLLTELGTRYNLTTDDVNDFNETVWSTAQDKKVPYQTLIAAADKFLEKTNDAQALSEQLDNIAVAMKGLGLDAQSAGELIGTSFNKGVKSAEDMLTLLDGIASSSQVGTGNLNEQLKGLLNLTHGTSWQQPEQLLQLLRMQRLSASEFGSDGQSSAALQSMFEAINDPQKRRILQRNGVDIYADKEKKQLNDPADLLLQIGEKAKYKQHNLDDVFSGDMLKLAMSFSDPAKQDALKQNQVVDGLISDKALRNVETFNGAMTSLVNAGEKFAQINLAKPIQQLADAINDLSPEELESYAETIKNIGIGIGAVVIGRKAYQSAKGIYDIFKDPTKAADALGSLGDEVGVVPVRVVNFDEFNGGSGDDRNNNMLEELRQFKDSRFNRGGLIGGAINTVIEINDILPTEDEFKARFEERQKNPPEMNPLSKWLFGDDEQQVASTSQQIDVSAFINEFLIKNQDALRLPQTELPVQQSKAEIKVKVEASDSLKIKSTQSTTSGNTDVSVATGNTFGETY